MLKIKVNCGCGFKATNLNAGQIHANKTKHEVEAHVVMTKTDPYDHQALDAEIQSENPPLKSGILRKHQVDNCCPHGQPAHECDACDVAGDLAYDAERERRLK